MAGGGGAGGMSGGFGGQPMGGFNQQGFQQPQGPSTSRMQEARMQQRFGQQGGQGGAQQTAQSLPTATPPPAEQSMNYLRSQGINTNFLQGGMNQSPQMGGFSGGMGVGSSPYSPMGGGYGMSGANPQMDGMGGFGGGQGPQMGGFAQTSPMGGMGQPPMAQFGNNFRPMGQFDPQKMQEMRGMQGMPMGGMGGFGQQRMQPPTMGQNMGQMGDDFVDRRTPEQRAQSQAQMNSRGMRGILDLMGSRFGQQGRM
jgi:hypothetical protein